ncbi:ribosomal RNA-processing protein 7 homolog A [Anabrus simplex]|uniref:ribosomal RNA-processing protein 7 homolog A n=1 Tax=Anabrus simplex TaxID=316456 RepID=UPI0035A328B8
MTLQGFKAFLVKFSTTSSTYRWLFVKEHSVRERTEGKPSGRTLFIINVPSYCSEECFKRLFEPCGEVTAVYFHQKPSASLSPMEDSSIFSKNLSIKGYKVAYVVFKTPKGLQSALKWETNVPLILSTEESPIVTGLKKWYEEYNSRIVDPNSMQKEIDMFMEKFDAEERKKAQQEKEAMEEDNEGWVTVTKKGRKPGLARKESVRKRIMSREKLKRSQKELHNFYTFQIRESKMKHLVNLRQKFEEDKKRIDHLKQSRRFRPY